MANSKNLGSYTDCQAAMDAALAHGGGKAILPNKGRAVSFGVRCNSFRKLLREKTAQGMPPGSIASTPYDEIIVKRPRPVTPHAAVDPNAYDDEEGHKEAVEKTLEAQKQSPWYVEFEPNRIGRLEFEAPDGQKVNLHNITGAAIDPEGDDLLEAALSLNLNSEGL